MVEHAIATGRRPTRADRYRAAERALWDRYGLAPTERFVESGPGGARLRVQEVGEGDALLLVHGSGPPGAGSVWAPLVAELSRFRCIVPDLPGAGLSAPAAGVGPSYPVQLADQLNGLLEQLNVRRAAVIGWSIGGIWSLRLAQRHPSRVSRLALMGFSPIWRDIRPPLSIRIQSTPVGRAMARLPTGERMVRSLLRRVVGHGASLDAGRIPDEVIDWIVAVMRETDSVRDGNRWIRHLIGLRGARPGFGFEIAEIAALRQPLLYVYGTDDWARTPEVVAKLLRHAAAAEACEVESGGHAPWLDDPHGVGEAVRQFLGAERP